MALDPHDLLACVIALQTRRARVLHASSARATLKTYQAKTGNPMMALTLGPSGGVTQLPPPFGAVRASWFNRKVKATHMLVPKFRKVFGL